MNPENLEDDLRPEYDFDFSKAVRGKYYKQYIERKHGVRSCSHALSLALNGSK